MSERLRSAPRLVGRYALYGKIASGGMATVHFGRLLGPVGFSRTVAIKRLHPQYTEDPDFVSMFLDEARLVARIRHPNVVPTLDVVASGGEILLVMEFVHGETLARLVRRLASKGERIPLPIVAAVFSGVLHGLHAAHEAKSERGTPLEIVHRDVSPHNVIIGVDGTPRVLDFGIARAVGRLQTTRDGQIKGKLAYMAPEQLSGANATRQTDVYAASVCLWEALTGKRLYEGPNEAALVSKVLAGEVKPPGEIAEGVPAAIDHIVLRGLAREPSARFATARDMASALEEAVALANPATTGRWVERTAPDALALQTEQLAEIDRASSEVTSPIVDMEATQPSLPPGLDPSADDPDPAAPEQSYSVSLPGTDATKAKVDAAAAGAVEGASPHRGRRVRTILLAGGAVVTASLAVALVMALRSGSPDADGRGTMAARGGDVAAEPSSPPDTEPPSSVAPVPATVVASSLVPADSPSPAPSRPAASTPSASARKPAPHAPASPPAKHAQPAPAHGAIVFTNPG